ncbi:DUF7064 domain-containing protein [Mycobacterium sp. NPDC051198]
MKRDGRAVNRYTPQDNYVHAAPAADDLHFQDSHWCMWYDDTRGLAGMHRFAVHPTLETSNYWCAVFSGAGGRYRSSGWDLPWTQPEDAAYRVAAGQEIDLSGNQYRVRVSEPGCEVDVVWESERPMFSYLGDDDTTAEMAGNHFEGVGRVTGTVILGGETTSVDAVAFRDRSWGPRLYSAVRAHRWFAGTLGPDLCFSATAVLAVGGRLVFDGILVDGDTHYRTSDVDIIIHQEADGLTHRGGELVMRFDNRPEFRVTGTVVDGAVFPAAAGSLQIVDTICVAESEGRTGFCNVEASNNIHADGPEPILGVRACIIDGLSTRAGNHDV